MGPVMFSLTTGLILQRSAVAAGSTLNNAQASVCFTNGEERQQWRQKSVSFTKTHSSTLTGSIIVVLNGSYRLDF